MILTSRRSATFAGWLLAAILCGAALPSPAQVAVTPDAPDTRVAANQRAAIEAYVRARRAYDEEASAYWQSIADKRRPIRSTSTETPINPVIEPSADRTALTRSVASRLSGERVWMGET